MLRKTLCVTAFGALFLIPFVPLVVSSSMFFPYITGKAFMFRILVEIAFAAWLGLAVLDASYRPKRSLMLIALGAFVVIVGLADVFGVNLIRSFWSNYERMEGFITILHLVLFAIALGSLFQKQKQWLYFWYTSLVASVFVSLNAYAQLADDKFRVDATLGNPTYLAVYLLFHVFFILWLLYVHRKERFWAIGMLLLLALELPVLYYTGTRGTLLGLAGGLGLAAFLALIFARKHPLVRKISGIAVVGILILTGAFFALRNTPVVQESPVLSRFADISLQDDTTQSRVTLWSSIAWNGFKERPLLGWGQDNFIVVFGKYYDPKMYKQEPWFDRAHNVFMDWLIAGGIFGLLAYLFLFGAGIWMLWKNRFSVPEKALFTGLFVGYAVHNFFVFDNLVSYIFFFAVLAWLHSVSVHEEGEQKVLTKPQTENKKQLVAVGAIAIVAVWAVWSLNFAEIGRAQTLITALRADQAEGDYAASYAAYDSLLADGPLGISEAREQLAQMAIRAASLARENPATQEIVIRAESELQKSITADSGNTRPLSFLSYLYLRLGVYDRALNVLDTLLAINPNRHIFLYDKGTALAALGRFQDALATYKYTYELDTTNDRALGLYVGALMQSGRHAEGDAMLVARFGTTTPDSDALLEGLLETKQYLRVAAIYRLRIGTERDSPQNRLSLAFALLRSGDQTGAIRELELAAETFPEALTDRVPGMIEAIRNGEL